MTDARLMIMLTLLKNSNRAVWHLLSTLLVLFLWIIGGSTSVFSQEFENLDSSYKDREPDYYLRLSLEYLDNERDIEETGYTDLSQKKAQKEGQGSLKFYFFTLDANYKAFDSEIQIGDNKTSLSDIRDNVSARAEFFEYLYFFAQKRNLDWEYTHIEDGSENFFENEKASAYLQGVGIVLGDWRLGISPGTSYEWTYRVDIDNQSAIREDIEFEANVWELVKKATDTQGPFYELGVKKWNDTDVKNNREGSLEKDEAFIMLGMGFSENTHIYLGGKASVGKITSVLLADNSDATRKSNYSNNVLGFRISIGEDSSVYIEQRYLRRKINFENTSYENTQRYQEEKITLGAEFNDQFSFELKFGKTRIEKSYIDRVIDPQSYRYQQTDNLIGISVKMRFSE